MQRQTATHTTRPGLTPEQERDLVQDLPNVRSIARLITPLFRTSMNNTREFHLANAGERNNKTAMEPGLGAPATPSAELLTHISRLVDRFVQLSRYSAPVPLAQSSNRQNLSLDWQHARR
jgi:hypothetical protein